MPRSENRPVCVAHVATVVCPFCQVPISERQQGDVIRCPQCNQRLLYETLEHRLSGIGVRIARMQDTIARWQQRRHLTR